MEEPNEIMDYLTRKIQEAETDSDFDLIVNDLSDKLSLDIKNTQLIVDCLRISVENDYATIDIFYGMINRILSTLVNNNVLDKNDINYIKDIGNND